MDAASLGRRRQRQRTGRTLIEGPHLLDAAVGTATVERIFALAGDGGAAQTAHRAGAELCTVSDHVLERIAQTASPRGPVAIIAIPDPPPLELRSTLVAWDIADPGNIGTIIRTGAALGVQVAVGGDSVDIWSPKVLRSAAGGHFVQRPVPIDAFDDVASAGLRTAAAVVSGGHSIHDVDLESGPTAVLVGSEARGLSCDVMEACQLSVSIPMSGGVESLNAAVTAAIIMYTMSSKR